MLAAMLRAEPETDRVVRLTLGHSFQTGKYKHKQKWINFALKWQGCYNCLQSLPGKGAIATSSPLGVNDDLCRWKCVGKACEARA